MRIYHCSLLAFAMMQASCDARQPAQRAAVLPLLTGEQMAERMQLCMSGMGPWRDRGIWKHGGVEPAVARDAWSELSESEKSEVAEIAACLLKSSGQFTPQTIQIVSKGFEVPVEEIEASNRLFASAFE